MKVKCAFVCVDSYYSRSTPDRMRMNPQCGSSKQQPYPRLERLGPVVVESISAGLLDDVHGIIHRSPKVKVTFPYAVSRKISCLIPLYDQSHNKSTRLSALTITCRTFTRVSSNYGLGSVVTTNR